MEDKKTITEETLVNMCQKYVDINKESWDFEESKFLQYADENQFNLIVLMIHKIALDYPHWDLNNGDIWSLKDYYNNLLSGG